MRIAIVNDLPMAVEGLRRVVERRGKHSIAWVAYNGEEAVRHCLTDVPDLMLLDMIMPGMNGVETTREVMKNSPCPILLVTSSVNKNSALVFEAMGHGALDAVNTPVLHGASEETQQSLLRKISMLAILSRPNSPEVRDYYRSMGKRTPSLKNNKILAIGASSGGPQALATVLRDIPRDFALPVVIVQHVDAHFASGLAEWLSTVSPLPVRLACEGDRPVGGTILLAGSDDHLVLQKDGTLGYSAEPVDIPYRPSVDVFWHSLDNFWQGEIIAVLLTGMGRDGAKSMLSLRQSGAFTIAQDRQSCAVYGMPKAAVELGAAVKVLPVESIMGEVLKNANKMV
ncbi:MAG TPA: chemotaxis response regulator protein-glutamate methylesterase [Gammaproteobacteria bacterium]|nr:chemotaxis response regulator protein-glutamate methylesterase [Gammaproteobacteria bacterium]